MARIIIIRNFYFYYITKSPTLDDMDDSDAVLCWQSTNHHVRLLLVCIYCVSVVIWCDGPTSGAPVWRVGEPLVPRVPVSDRRSL